MDRSIRLLSIQSNFSKIYAFIYQKMCFITNGIDGKKLIQIDANTLPKMGITKFEDIQVIKYENNYY